MTAAQLADYLINNDCELLVVRREIDAILEVVRDERLGADLDTVLKALDIANDDPIIRQFYRRFA